MVSTSGHRLLPLEAVSAFREQIIPLATILTPNIPEAILLLSGSGASRDDPKDIEELVKLAKDVLALGPKYVLLKGGHRPLKKNGSAASEEEGREIVVDVLVSEGKVIKIEKPCFESKNTHGTGCSLACK